MQNPTSVNAELSKLRVAIVHYWFIARCGGERVVEALAEIFPQADIFSLVVDRSTLAPTLQNRKLQTSFLQRVPGAKRFHRHFLFLHPLALEQFDLSEYDLVISSESGPAKGVITSPKTCHICYCHSPMRYAWDQFDAYFGPERLGKVGSRLMRPVMAGLARWDRDTAYRADRYVAISHYVAGRIRRYYNREATVVYPPVDTEFFHPDSAVPGRHALIVSALVPYKRLDLAIDACRIAGVPLKMVAQISTVYV